MWTYNYSNELYHHGVLGMKWGVRRYQNKDGSLTAAGRKRYGSGEIHEDYQKAHTKKSVKSMSDQELRAINNRLNMERNYKKMTSKPSQAEKIVKTFISTAGLVSGVLAAAHTYKDAVNTIIDVAKTVNIDDIT